VKFGVGTCYLFFTSATLYAAFKASDRFMNENSEWFSVKISEFPIYFLPFILHLLWQIKTFKPQNSSLSLILFKSNKFLALLLIIGFILLHIKTQTVWIPDFISPKLD
jgi:glucan phosphoethanolaminetransferase (alkaline phosphatase superfamily)